MKRNNGKEHHITEMDSAAVVVAGIIRFLQLFVPITLARRLPAMLLLALGVSDKRVEELTGLGNRTVRGLRKQVKSCGSAEDAGALLTIKKPGRTRCKTQGIEEQIFEELGKRNFSTRKEAAAIIKETFDVELSVSTVGRLLKKGASKG